MNWWLIIDSENPAVDSYLKVALRVFPRRNDQNGPGNFRPKFAHSGEYWHQPLSTIRVHDIQSLAINNTYNYWVIVITDAYSTVDSPIIHCSPLLTLLHHHEPWCISVLQRSPRSVATRWSWLGNAGERDVAHWVLRSCSEKATKGDLWSYRSMARVGGVGWVILIMLTQD